MAQPSSEKTPSVYLYIPNIIGYFRIIINFIAFAVCYSNRLLFAILYFFSFFCDGLDGWFARKFNQASTFGAVLDMVTDRYSNKSLDLVYAVCKMRFLRTWLSFLDSAWVGYYKPLVSDVQFMVLFFTSSFLSGKTSHKDVKDTGNWLLKLYYGHRPFMAFCCVASEVCRGLLKQSPLIVFVFISTLVGWALKQVINVIQMKTAADACVVFDLKRVVYTNLK
uniref:CDP-diacylglycerol--inositol 3-phosphatidyltransferase n=1 Tax=Leersia perrieri TaxID=77586 RepID=A0A0D9VEK9_9ORYZ